MIRILLAFVLGIFIATNLGCGNTSSGENAPQTVSFINTPYAPDIYSQEYSNGDEIVIQFSADWCGPCRLLKKEIAKSESLQEHFRINTEGYFIVDVDSVADNDRKWIEKAKPRSIPLVVRYIYFNGEWVEHSRFIGFQKASWILTWLQKI